MLLFLKIEERELRLSPEKVKIVEKIAQLSGYRKIKY